MELINSDSMKVKENFKSFIKIKLDFKDLKKDLKLSGNGQDSKKCKIKADLDCTSKKMSPLK